MESIFDRLQNEDRKTGTMTAFKVQLLENLDCSETSTERCSEGNKNSDSEREGSVSVGGIKSCPLDQVGKEKGSEKSVFNLLLQDYRREAGEEVDSHLVSTQSFTTHSPRESEANGYIPSQILPDSFVFADGKRLRDHCTSEGDSFIPETGLNPLVSPSSACTSGFESALNSACIDSSFGDQFSYTDHFPSPPTSPPPDSHLGTEHVQYYGSAEDMCNGAVEAADHENSDTLQSLQGDSNTKDNSVVAGNCTCSTPNCDASRSKLLSTTLTGHVLPDFNTVNLTNETSADSLLSSDYIPTGSESSKLVRNGYVTSESNFSSTYIMSGSESSRQVGDGYII